MTQRSNSRQASASAGARSRGPKVDPDFQITLAYDPKNARKSVGLVNPLVLESFIEDTRNTLERRERKNTVTVGRKKQSIQILVNEEPSTSNKTPNTSKSKTVINNEPKLRKGAINKTETNTKPKKQTTLDANAKKDEVLPKRELRSTRKYAEFKRELKSVKDFSIEIMDWYYEDEAYYKRMLQLVMSDFAIPKENRREGNAKLSYNYMLLDSRNCRNKRNISWIDFIEAIFYIGKGKNKRAFQHAEEAEELLSSKASDQKKCKKIKEIWDSGSPIKVFFVAENVIAEEALTREAAMIEAMGLSRLCNKIRGSYYGVAVTMKARECLELGATLLMEARDIFKWKGTIDVYSKKQNESVVVSLVREN